MMDKFKYQNSSRHWIKQTARSLFKSRGYDSTTLEDIAVKSNISVKDIAIYFQSKDELLEAVWSE